MLRPWSTIIEVKQRLREALAVPPHMPTPWMRLFYKLHECHNTMRLIDLIPVPVAKGMRPPAHSRGITLLLKTQNPRDFEVPFYIHPWGADVNAVPPPLRIVNPKD